MDRTTHNRDSIHDFVEWAKTLRGYEKGEAQTFLDRLFRAFGHAGAMEAGARFEDPLKRISGRRTATNFVDLLWQPRVLIEMKSRGEKLERHASQAIEYWWNLAPNRPEFVILCNFDEFWIFNFNKEVQEPLAKIHINNLAARSEALSFLLPTPKEPLFDPNRLGVTMDAASQLADVYTSMLGNQRRGIEQADAQRFILQCIMAMFSEDLELLPRGHFTRVLRDSLSDKNPGQRAEELIGGLFRQMNSSRSAPVGSRHENVRYFNGGLFSEVRPVVLTREELEALSLASDRDWTLVNPSIFGTLFQQSMDPEERHRHGAHFTSENDILKVVNPTIVRPWRERIAKASSLKQLVAIRNELLNFKVLDPACGSGNFLYVAFRELKRLELDLLLAIRDEFKSDRARASIRSYLSTKQFFGFDVLDFGVELTKVTLLLAKEIALAETINALEEDQGAFEFDSALPLDNLDSNIKKTDALFSDWPKVDAIIGNPPFQSKNKAQRELGREHLARLRERYPEIDGKADYCVYFFRRAHDELSNGARAGLVGTNTIRQNTSREGGLEWIIGNGGTITEAVSTQPWSGDATVHVSIVNWTKGVVGGNKKLFFEDENAEPRFIEMPTINAMLAEYDVSGAQDLSINAKPEFCAQGQTHGHDGFLVEREEAEIFLNKHPSAREVLVPFLIGDDLLERRSGLHLSKVDRLRERSTRSAMA